MASAGFPTASSRSSPRRRARRPASFLSLRDSTGQTVELDLRQGPEAAVTGYRARTEPAQSPPARPGRGRPKLGVVAREVTLLPRHWDWLAAQPGGASAVSVGRGTRPERRAPDPSRPAVARRPSTA